MYVTVLDMKERKRWGGGGGGESREEKRREGEKERGRRGEGEKRERKRGEGIGYMHVTGKEGRGRKRRGRSRRCDCFGLSGAPAEDGVARRQGGAEENLDGPPSHDQPSEPLHCPILRLRHMECTCTVSRV